MLRGTTLLAPMLGVSDNPGFLRLCKQNGCDVLILPMVFTKGILANSSYVTVKLEAVENGMNINGVDPRPLVVQVIGDLPAGHDERQRIVDILSSHDIDGINYNLGCPSVKVKRLGLGAALMCDAGRRDDIIEALVAASTVPVSVKIRLIGKNNGIEPDVPASIEACRSLERAGVAWIAVHGRTLARGYGGSADWAAIKAIHDEIDVPVVGNGDITSAALGHELVASGHADAFMIGRAAMHDPRVFDRARLEPGGKTWEDVASMHRDLLATCEAAGTVDLQEARDWAMRFSKGIPGGKQFRARVGTCRSVACVTGLLEGTWT